jgi:hypothetical protein
MFCFARIACVALCLSLLSSGGALAQGADCHARIDAMFDGGALDPFARPPHQFTNTVLSPEGDMRYQMLAIWDTPARSIAGIVGMGNFTMIVSGDSWTGPSPEGPWMAAPNMLPDGYEESQRAQLAQQRKNLTDTACDGLVDLGSETFDSVTFFTKTDPAEGPGASWFGARNTVYIDPQEKRVMRWEMTNFVSSFAPGVNADIHVQIFSYDDPVSISAPQ